jgi:hypothetical protein
MRLSSSLLGVLFLSAGGWSHAKGLVARFIFGGDVVHPPTVHEALRSEPLFVLRLALQQASTSDDSVALSLCGALVLCPALGSLTEASPRLEAAMTCEVPQLCELDMMLGNSAVLREPIPHVCA